MTGKHLSRRAVLRGLGAASAYLSGDAAQLGSLKGQDVGKLIVGGLLLAGCVLATLAIPELSSMDVQPFQDATDYLINTILK